MICYSLSAYSEFRRSCDIILHLVVFIEGPLLPDIVEDRFGFSCAPACD